MHTILRQPIPMLLTVSVCLALGVQELSYCARRSDSRADLTAGASVIYDGETDHLDFRLTDLQAASLDSLELMLLRNAIFARRGYAFRNGTIRSHFLQFDWYEPVCDDVSSMLDDTDLWNISLLRYFEDRLDEDDQSLTDSGQLTGFWHGSASVGSGYSERYLLEDDGTFIYRGNSMDGSDRLEELSGSWNLDGGHLVLTADSAVILVGGEPAEPYASYGSDYVIENGVSTPSPIDPPLVLRLPVDGYTASYAETCGNDAYDHLTVPYMRIGTGGFWRISTDTGSLEDW